MKKIIKNLLLLVILTTPVHLFCSNDEPTAWDKSLELLITLIKEDSSQTHTHLQNFLNILSKSLPKDYIKTNNGQKILTKIRQFLSEKLASNKCPFELRTRTLIKEILTEVDNQHLALKLQKALANLNSATSINSVKYSLLFNVCWTITKEASKKFINSPRYKDLILNIITSLEKKRDSKHDFISKTVELCLYEIQRKTNSNNPQVV